jgi:multisubunit Na+/H+ antiporter MnhC subunit
VNSATSSGGWSKLLGIVTAVVSIGAGIYLLLGESASEEMTVIDILMDGIGAYFIARGVWMLATLGRLT